MADSATTSNVIVRMPNWLGDLVMATPVLHDLRAHFPNARITAMCLAGQSALLENNPYIDTLLRFQRPSGWIHRFHHAHVFDELRKNAYDVGILLPNSFTSAWWFWRGHVKRRIGYIDHGRRLLLNDPVSYPEDRKTLHQVTLYKRLLAPLGIPVSDTKPELFVNSEAQKAVKALLRDRGVQSQDTLIGINPGAAYGTAKCWPPERFKALTQQLLVETDYPIVYFGDHASAPVVNDICSSCGASDRLINLAGKTSLSELVAAIQACSVLLTNDSGPMHIAAALGTPPLALFGSTSDVATSPYKFGRVIHKHVECSPCYKRVCPIDFRCMTRIEVDEVFRELQMLIEQSQHARKS